MSEKIEGYSYQEHEPTPDMPCEVKCLRLYEVNGVIYQDNIPDNMRIGITKEQYCEYLQLQEKNNQLRKTIEQVRTAIDYMIGNVDISEIHGTKLKQMLDKVSDSDE